MQGAAAANPLKVIAQDVKLSHSVFALPFALLATFLAAGASPGWGPLLLIVVCMFLARTFAMLANRYLDRTIDAANPRTAGRAIPSGKVTAGQVLAVALASAAGLVAGAAMFGVLFDNWWPVIASPFVLGWLWAYGLFKRFTWLCHFFLGGALALSPLAAGLAIEPSYLAQPTLWWLAAFVLLWVAGFDVVYALQDEQVDRRDGIYSVPAKLGRGGALLLAKGVHLLALIMLLMAYRSEPMLSTLFFVGIVVVGLLMVIEHRAASMGRFSMAFFTLNGIISLLLGVLGIVDILRT
ncbi:MAG: UbiA-like polyprenyltransferase [Phycisphaeraceae bacterium]